MTGGALIAQDKIRKIVFNGYPEAGLQVARLAADRLKPCAVGLHGKGTAIVFDDADCDKLAQAMRRGVFAEHGGVMRLLVQHDVFEIVVQRMVDEAARVRIGLPLDDETELGPAVGARQMMQTARLVEQTAADGAWRMGGTLSPDLPRGGHWLAPSVLGRVAAQSPLLREPICGPVMVVMPFTNEAEAIAMAHDDRGCANASVWTQDPGRAHRVAGSLRAGTVWINDIGALHAAVPMGGTDKAGYGRFLGAEAMAEYTETRAVWVDLRV